MLFLAGVRAAREGLSGLGSEAGEMADEDPTQNAIRKLYAAQISFLSLHTGFEK